MINVKKFLLTWEVNNVSKLNFQVNCHPKLTLRIIFLFEIVPLYAK